jgi:ribonuclease T
LVFISVDVEASGTVPGFFDLLSIGAVPVLRQHGRYVVGEPDFYVELKPVLGTTNPASMKVNGLDLERLRREGMEPANAAAEFARYVKSFARRHDPPVFVGYCAHFDWGFVNDLFTRAGMENPFGYKALDLRSLSYGLFPCDWHRLGQTRLMQYLDMQPLPPDKAHHGLHDARHQGEMLIKMLEARAAAQRSA